MQQNLGIGLDYNLICGNLNMTKLNFITAQLSDVEEIIGLLQNDILGKSREHADVNIYKQGLEAIIDDANNYFFLAYLDLKIVGCFQLTFIPSLSRGASKRAQIESVRVKEDFRGQKLGSEMMNWAKDFAKKNGCNLLQLTTDKFRDDALRFYEKLGYEASHNGMKLKI